jgi:NADH:ubiquinone oxidoreductase subunit E
VRISGKITVIVCVGSSCHIKGAREIIGRFNELIKNHQLETKVDLKGSFCMERCGKGINWQIDDVPYTSETPEKAEAIFTERVIKQCKKGA